MIALKIIASGSPYFAVAARISQSNRSTLSPSWVVTSPVCSASVVQLLPMLVGPSPDAIVLLLPHPIASTTSNMDLIWPLYRRRNSRAGDKHELWPQIPIGVAHCQ